MAGEKLKEAVNGLIARPAISYNYPNPKSRLEEALQQAAHRSAVQLIGKRFEEDTEIQEQLQALFTEAWTKVIAKDGPLREQIVSKIAYAISEGFVQR